MRRLELLEVLRHPSLLVFRLLSSFNSFCFLRPSPTSEDIAYVALKDICSYSLYPFTAKLTLQNIYQTTTPVPSAQILWATLETHLEPGQCQLGRSDDAKNL